MKWPELKLHKHLLEIDPQDAAAIAEGCGVSPETKRRCGNHLKHVFENATSGQLYKNYATVHGWSHTYATFRTNAQWWGFVELIADASNRNGSHGVGAVLTESSDLECWDEPSMNSFEWVIPDNMSVTSSNVSTPIGYREYSEVSARIDYREYRPDRINMHVRTEVLRHIPDYVDINLMDMTDESLLELFRGLTSHQMREKHMKMQAETGKTDEFLCVQCKVKLVHLDPITAKMHKYCSRTCAAGDHPHVLDVSLSALSLEADGTDGLGGVMVRRRLSRSH
jgi:hypothetical protein